MMSFYGLIICAKQVCARLISSKQKENTLKAQEMKESKINKKITKKLLAEKTKNSGYISCYSL